mgnify:CR=1 FL=1
MLVQGIADVVLVFDDHAEILDYKTDKSRNATYYIESYAAQLRLYRRAFALRLPVPVTKLTIYSFAMQDEIDIPLEYAAYGIGENHMGRERELYLPAHLDAWALVCYYSNTSFAGLFFCAHF